MSVPGFTMQIRSRGNPDLWYTVTRTPDGYTTCGCKGFSYRGGCRHIHAAVAEHDHAMAWAVQRILRLYHAVATEGDEAKARQFAEAYRVAGQAVQRANACARAWAMAAEEASESAEERGHRAIATFGGDDTGSVA